MTLAPHIEKLIDDVRTFDGGDERPTEAAVKKLREVLEVLNLPPAGDLPDVQIDRDGEFALYWDQDGERQASMDFTKHGELVCIRTAIFAGERPNISEIVRINNNDDLLNFYNNHCEKDHEK